MSPITTIEDVNHGLGILTDTDSDLADALQFVHETGLDVPLRLRPGGFTGLSEIVISQLVSKASANAINQRLKEHIPDLTPDNCLNATDDMWRAMGMSRAKQATLCAIATALKECRLDLDALSGLPVDQAVDQLTHIKGVGPWTADVYLLFCIGHRDIFPSGDLALREAVKIIWSMDERPLDQDLRIFAQRWSPWRGIAARLLWAYYAAMKKRQVMP